MEETREKEKSSAEVVRAWLRKGEACLRSEGEERGEQFDGTAESSLFSICHELLDACETVLVDITKGDGTTTECHVSYLLDEAIEACAKEIEK